MRKLPASHRLHLFPLIYTDCSKFAITLVPLLSLQSSFFNETLVYTAFMDPITCTSRLKAMSRIQAHGRTFCDSLLLKHTVHFTRSATTNARIASSTSSHFDSRADIGAGDRTGVVFELSAMPQGHTKLSPRGQVIRGDICGGCLEESTNAGKRCARPQQNWGEVKAQRKQ